MAACPPRRNAMLNDVGQVVRVVHGPVPLWGARRGEDVMMTDVLAFDVRVYDPGAPLFGYRYQGGLDSKPYWNRVTRVGVVSRPIRRCQGHICTPTTCGKMARV